MSTQSLEDRVGAVEDEVRTTRRLIEGHISSVNGLSEALAANTAATTRIEVAVEANRVNAEAAVKAVTTSNEAMLGFFNNMVGAFKVFDLIGKLAKPLGYIMIFVGALVSIWATVTGKGPIK